MPNRFRAYCIYGLSVLLLGVLFLAPQYTSAAGYGRGTYGDCSYQGCSQAFTETHLQMPSGLQVSINLTDGQVIPRSGYTIVVTPLNGQGTSFERVDFYINDTLIRGSILPDETGTARWEWQPARYPGSHIKIVITDRGGSHITREFTVRIAPAATTESATSQATGISAIFAHAADRAGRVIAQLPRPVVYGFPYLLFVLLGVNVVLLLFQAKHEVVEYRKLQLLLSRLRVMSDGKKAFMDLASHYLRTPVTLIGGGIDMLDSGNLPARRLVDLQAVNKRLGRSVETLVSHVVAASKAVASAQGIAAVRIWNQPGLFAPVLLIGAVAFSFTSLTAHAGSFTITQLNVTTQVIIFSVLAVATYAAVRRRQLHRRDAALLRLIIHQESTIAEAQDMLITSTVKALQADLNTLAALIAPIGASQAVTFVRNGQDRFRDLIAKFAMAANLRGAHSKKAFATVSLGQILETGQRRLREKLDTKGIRIISNAEAKLSVQDTALLSFVLSNVIDNAAAFSPAKGTITVDLQKNEDGALLHIVDHGPGVPAAKQALLFKPFSKAEGAETFNHEGIGLSLYIDKLIMTYLGGSINLQSQPGQTTVSLQLPIS